MGYSKHLNISKEYLIQNKEVLFKALETETIGSLSKKLKIDSAVLSRLLKHKMGFKTNHSEGAYKFWINRKLKKQKELEALAMDEGYIQATKEQLKKIQEELKPLEARRHNLMVERLRLERLLKDIGKAKKGMETKE